MILKKQEKDNLIKAVYDSSTIAASTYNKETTDLVIIFSKGGQYKYPGVIATDYTLFESAESQGKVLNTHIKKYPFQRLEDVDPAAIITEINNLKAAEKKAHIEGLQDYLVREMKGLIALAESPKIFNSEDLEPLQKKITDFMTALQ